MGDTDLNPAFLIGAVSSLAFSGLFYRLYKSKKEELLKLKEIPLFKPDEHLLKVLLATPHRRLKYVAVEGLVLADEEPIASRFVPRCFGVIQRVTEEERWKYWNSHTNTWTSRTANKKETNNSVPFSLVSPGSYISDLFVKVQNPLESSGSFLENVYYRRKSATEGLGSIALQSLSGEKPDAMVESEELLQVGSTLTGFGEVVLERDRVMRLQAPQDGRSYVLVSGDHASFIGLHEKSASMWKILTAVTGITGVSLLAGVAQSLASKKDKK